jgi:CheY-like chemotaxis protein
MTHAALACSAWPPAFAARPVAQAAPLILVIDDSLTVRAIFATLLHPAGLALASFPDGPSALHWLASPNATLPALIFLDLELPRMDGYEVARRLRCLPGLFDVPLVLLSGSQRLCDPLASQLVGVSAHLLKPFQAAQVLELTRSLLASKLGVSY